MKAIPELNKGDMININGEIYQLIGHSEFAGSLNAERVLELGRLGERIPSPVLRVIYPADNPTSLRLEALDRRSGVWSPQKLIKFGY